MSFPRTRSQQLVIALCLVVSLLGRKISACSFSQLESENKIWHLKCVFARDSVFEPAMVPGSEQMLILSILACWCQAIKERHCHLKSYILLLAFMWQTYSVGFLTSFKVASNLMSFHFAPDERLWTFEKSVTQISSSLSTSGRVSRIIWD